MDSRPSYENNQIKIIQNQKIEKRKVERVKKKKKKRILKRWKEIGQEEQSEEELRRERTKGVCEAEL